MEKLLEKCAEAVHKAYCDYYLKNHNGEQYWTYGDYSLLDEPTKQIDRETVLAVFEILKANQLEPEVKPDNGGKFEGAYKYAMDVLENYILMTRDRWAESKSDESKEHYSMKEQFMRTAKRTIEENYKSYLRNSR